jgi:hypothetical protein
MHTDAAAVRGGKLAATYYPVLFKDPDGIQDGGMLCAVSDRGSVFPLRDLVHFHIGTDPGSVIG